MTADVSRRNGNLPIDRGWAWVVLCAVFCRCALVGGLTATLSILFVEFMNKYNASTAATSWIPGIVTFLQFGMGPFANAMAMRYTIRAVMLVGTGFFSLGFVLSAFVTNIWQLYLSYGILIGVGFGLTISPSYVVIVHYFEKRQSLANGIAVSGAAFGSATIPIITRYLLDEYSLQGTLLLLGGISANQFVFSALLRPLDFYLNKRSDTSIANKTESNNRKASHCSVPASVVIANPNSDNKTEHTCRKNSKHNLPSLENTLPLLDATLSQNKDLEAYNDATEFMNFIQRQRSKSNVERIRQHSFTVDETKTSPLFSISEQDIKTVVGKSLIKPTSHTKWLVASAMGIANEDIFSAALQNFSVWSLNENLEDLSPNEKSDVGLKSYFSRMFVVQVKNPKTGIVVGTTGIFHLSLLKKPIFTLILISTFLGTLGLPTPKVMLGAYGESLGFERSSTALIISLSGITGIFIAPLMGWFADFNIFPKTYMQVAFAFIIAGLCFIWSHVTSFSGLLILALLYEANVACWVSLVLVVLVEKLGAEVISQSVGLSMVARSFGAVAGTPLAGFLRDVTGSWFWTFMFSGICVVLSGLCLLLIPLVQRCRDKEDAGENNQSVAKL